MRPTPWLVSAASVMGSRHARSVTDCQDSFATHQDADTLVLACADGGSRARLARTASSLAVTLTVNRAADEARRMPPDVRDGHDRARVAEVAEHWARHLDRVTGDVVRGFRAAAAAMASSLPDRHGWGPAEWGTTLTLVVVRRPWLGVVAIGDGFVVTRCGAEQFDLLLAPYATPAHRPGPVSRTAQRLASRFDEPGRTLFVTSRGAEVRARRVVARLPDLTGVVVASDGLREVGLVHERAQAVRPHGRFFTPLFAHADNAAEDDTYLARLLAGERMAARTHDDKTLVVAVERV
ncbi:protein phosphatase 2C domain-containing protein [Streptomyces sp. YKOK-I1]